MHESIFVVYIFSVILAACAAYSVLISSLQRTANLKWLLSETILLATTSLLTLVLTLVTREFSNTILYTTTALTTFTVLAALWSVYATKTSDNPQIKPIPVLLACCLFASTTAVFLLEIVYLTTL